MERPVFPSFSPSHARHVSCRWVGQLELKANIKKGEPVDRDYCFNEVEKRAVRVVLR